jgi:hypothetical protein
MIAPLVPAAMWRRPNSREQKKVPFSTMSTTVRQPFGLRSSAGTGKLPAALFTRTVGCENTSAIWSNAVAT